MLRSLLTFSQVKLNVQKLAFEYSNIEYNGSMTTSMFVVQASTGVHVANLTSVIGIHDYINLSRKTLKDRKEETDMKSVCMSIERCSADLYAWCFMRS